MSTQPITALTSDNGHYPRRCQLPQGPGYATSTPAGRHQQVYHFSSSFTLMTTSTVLPLDDDDGGALPQVNLHHSRHPIPMPSIDDNPSGVVATTYHNIQPHRVNTCVPALAGVSFALSLLVSAQLCPVSASPSRL